MRIRVHRIAFAALVLASLAGVGWMLAAQAASGTGSLLGWAMAGLGVVLLAPIVVSFWMAGVGFVLQLTGRESTPPALAEDGDPSRPVASRTAIVIPIYHEDPERVLAGLSAMRASLAETGQADAFEFHLLSDTTDPHLWIEEELAISRYCAELREPARVHYRNRPQNDGKKAGNIADFCASHGDDYRYMIVLDADSVMSGATLVRLVHIMDSNPDIGIVQVPAVPANRRTLFGRLQQFAARAYGPTWTAGLASLQGGTGNYYGHNAILRIAPFAEHCRLPTLPGKAPLGGHVLSHDFIEAAFMRRAGYRVYLASRLDGSFEEPPASLVDFAARDRRWCQGNLQHVRLLATPGLRLISRLHLLMGILAYVTSPLWILLLLLTTLEWTARPEAGAAGGSHAARLLLVVGILLFVPRLLAVLARCRDERERPLFGGGARLVASGLLEMLLSTLVAPILALAHTGFVVSVLLGEDGGWSSSPRDDHGTSFLEACRHHGIATVLGVVWGWVLFHLSPVAFLWMLPVLAGMVFSIPLSVWTSGVSAGDRARRLGLFLTPEESDPPRVLEELREELDRRRPGPSAGDPRGALQRVLSDPEVRSVHLSYARTGRGADPARRKVLKRLQVKIREHGPHSLSRSEQRTILLHPEALAEIEPRSS